jgi:signal recognition particle GTPase
VGLGHDFLALGEFGPEAEQFRADRIARRQLGGGALDALDEAEWFVG